MKHGCCPPHTFKPDKDGVDRCLFCFVTWREWTFGFATNVRPKRQGKPPRSARP